MKILKNTGDVIWKLRHSKWTSFLSGEKILLLKKLREE